MPWGRALSLPLSVTLGKAQTRETCCQGPSALPDLSSRRHEPEPCTMKAELHAFLVFSLQRGVPQHLSQCCCDTTPAAVLNSRQSVSAMSPWGLRGCGLKTHVKPNSHLTCAPHFCRCRTSSSATCY